MQKDVEAIETYLRYRAPESGDCVAYVLQNFGPRLFAIL